MFYIDLYMEHLKSSSLKPQESIFGMYHHQVDVLSLLKIMALLPKISPPQGSRFYI